MTDEEALEALRDGDASAMQLLVEHHQLRGLRLAYQLPGTGRPPKRLSPTPS